MLITQPHIQSAVAGDRVFVMAQEPEPAARALNIKVDNAARVKEKEGADAGEGGRKEASV